MVYHVKQSYTPFYELKQIETLLQILEQKLQDFTKFYFYCIAAGD
jgi:hypothetical protein